MSDLRNASTQRLEFYRGLAERATRILRQEPNEALEHFRTHIIPRPDAIRRKILGGIALRSRQLSDRKKAWRRGLDVVPDLLSPIGRLRDECLHSQLIAFHLDRAKSPALSSPCTSAFMRLLEHSDDGPYRVSVESHLPGGNGRVDLRLETANTLIYVEVKVDADEGNEQLKRYRTAMNRERGHRTGILVYLTLDQSVSAMSDKPDRRLSFGKVLEAWLPIAAGQTDAAAYLGRYLKSVALLLGCAEEGEFEDWSFANQRQLLELLEGMDDEED